MFVPLFFIIITVLLNCESSSIDFEKPVTADWVLEQKYPRNCYEALFRPQKPATNIELIQVDNFGSNPFLVACEQDLFGGGWTIIQSRSNGSVNFYRGWNDYKFGFGSLTEEFWLGLDKIHALTTNVLQELLVVLKDFEGETRTARYKLFAIGNENEGYAIKLLGNYTGSAGDSMRYHESYKFSTMDRNNGPNGACPSSNAGAWWYNNCYRSNLNGDYLRGALSNGNYKGMSWQAWHGFFYSLKSSQMMIRPAFL